MIALSRIRKHPTLLCGLVLTVLLIAAALVSFVWTPGDPVRLRIALRLKAPLEAGLLGADQLGRDMASLVMIGARNTLIVAWPAVLAGACVGILLGSFAASRRGRVDRIIMRVCDVTFAFPALLIAIMIGAVYGGGPLAAIWAIALFNVPVFARVTRGAAQKIWAMDYILAAKALGKSRWAIAIEDVLPNIAGVIIIQLMVQLAMAIIMEAGFSYVGIGFAPPDPSWGRMLKEAQTYIGIAPHLILVPGCAIAFAVLGLNLLGDGLRDMLDPAMRRRNHKS
ncbi:ABC transporter permease [Microvirga sp. W0021]|uniref:ABC transporter permease n=1 Tax=Hohaiivirga grylli TaxID=3133970 RepID=A0ABV0BH00_9HYPH